MCLAALWHPRRRTQFMVEVPASPGGPATPQTLHLQSPFHARTPLRSIFAEAVEQLSQTAGFPAVSSVGSGGLAFLILITGPPARSFILRRSSTVAANGVVSEWELMDHSTGSIVNITPDHVACHLMLERSDTVIHAYPTYAQGTPKSQTGRSMFHGS